MVGPDRIPEDTLRTCSSSSHLVALLKIRRVEICTTNGQALVYTVRAILLSNSTFYQVQVVD